MCMCVHACVRACVCDSLIYNYITSECNCHKICVYMSHECVKDRSVVYESIQVLSLTLTLFYNQILFQLSRLKSHFDKHGQE